jgi:phosphoribosyl-ATP pyrophosphohydrolase
VTDSSSEGSASDWNGSRMGEEAPDPAGVLHEIEAVLGDRLATRPEGSYSVTLVTDVEKVQRKIVEEAFELCLELGRSGRADFAPDRVAGEAADVVFHVLAGLVATGVPLDAVLGELAERRGGGR